MSRLNKQAGANPKLEYCLVTDKQMVAPGYGRLTLQAPFIAREASPGQFVQVFMPPECQPMLPRPFSIYGSDRHRGELSILFAVRGRGTSLLAGTGPGGAWRLLGPLGNGFPGLPPGSLLVAGGMGIAPLAFLAASTEIPRILIYGAPTAARLVCSSADLNLPGLTVLEATEDGSRGEPGTAVDLLFRRISSAQAVFACGPCRMLSAVSSLCRQAGVKAWVSMEERMACGIGACLGCAVATPGGYKRVCRDGPVFPAEEVCLDERTEQ